MDHVWIARCFCSKKSVVNCRRNDVSIFIPVAFHLLDWRWHYKKWQITIVLWCRILELHHLMIRSWRLWLCSAACRWPCLESLTYSIIVLHRYKHIYTVHTIIHSLTTCLHAICVIWCVCVRVCKQCRQVKIIIKGDEGVPVQVDGEAWIQPPGIVQILHKNRAQMLTRDRVSVHMTCRPFFCS